MKPSGWDILQALQRALHEDPEQSLAAFWAGLSEEPPEQAQLLSADLLRQQLYAGLARPWERLKRNKQKKSVLKKRLATEWSTFEILNLQPALARKPVTLSFVLEFLRNAISHDKLRLDGELNATFSDWEQNRLRFTLSELQQFMNAFREFREDG